MLRIAAIIIATVLCCGVAHAGSAPSETPKPVLDIARITVVPTIEDFLDMRPSARLSGEMTEVRDFIQREPHDGEPASDATVVYAGYDSRNLYVAFVCFDRRPPQIRSGVTRRENVWDDDRVHVMLDTFNDQRRGYSFIANPHGVQYDGTWSEKTGSDGSFDTVWQSAGRITDRGYVVLFAIPFKSLRFPVGREQHWGVYFERVNVRSGESVYWPRNTRRIEGWLNQAARLEGLREISPGRHMQFIPYSVIRSYRAPDFPNATFIKRTTADVGLDSKFVLLDSLVLDTAINPDFSQVESDAPQVTVNQRYEVYFPEKRPFFLENASFFETPFPLLFTRRIADPQYGAKLSGKAGRYAIGALIADDRSVSADAVPGDAAYGNRAYFGVVRVNRDILKQSTLGGMFTERRFDGEFNRVGSVDTNLKLNSHWYLVGQAATSATRFSDGSSRAGSAYYGSIGYGKNDAWASAAYTDISPGFVSSPGFIYRVGYRQAEQNFSYRLRPKRKTSLLSWAPSATTTVMWDYDGRPVERGYNLGTVWNFKRQSSIAAEWKQRVLTLRPSEFASLESDRNYHTHIFGVTARSGIWRMVNFGAGVWRQGSINYVPISGPPRPSTSDSMTAYVNVRPSPRLLIDNTYTLLRVGERGTGDGVFTNHLVRTRWNWQLSRELAVRVIGTYEAVLANREATYLRTTKSLNGDFLLSYMLHPGTAVYVGYNSNLENIDPALRTDTDGYLLRTRRSFINDSRQVFIKLSYLFRY